MAQGSRHAHEGILQRKGGTRMSPLILLALGFQMTDIEESRAIVAAVQAGAKDWNGSRLKPFAFGRYKDAVPTREFDFARRLLSRQGMLSIPAKAGFTIAVREISRPQTRMRGVTLDLRDRRGGGCRTRYTVESFDGVWLVTARKNILAY